MVGSRSSGALIGSPTMGQLLPDSLKIAAFVEQVGGVTEVDVRAMLARATVFNRNVVEGRFIIRTRHKQQAWNVIVEPDDDLKELVVVTVYEVHE